MVKKKMMKPSAIQKEDAYRLSARELEVDTDVNEDPQREALLDDSVASFLDWQANQQ